MTSSSKQFKKSKFSSVQPSPHKIYALLAVVTLTLSWFFTPLSSLVVDILINMIPVDQDVSIGREAIKTANYKIIYDSYGIGLIGKELVAKLPSQYRSYSFSFQIIDENYVNAFAYPGGFIYVTDELLKLDHISRDEVAAVLSHEIGHVISRHSMKRIISTQVIQWIIKAITRDDGDDYQETFTENMIEMFIENASKFGLLKYSRTNEFEADTEGINLMIRTNGQYNPSGMIRFFEKLMKLSGEKTSGITNGFIVDTWLSTHPATSERINELKRILA